MTFTIAQSQAILLSDTMTVEQATDVLNAMRNTSNEQVFAMPFNTFKAIVMLIGHSQYTFYKAGLYDLEDESASLESAWYQREMINA